MWIDTGGTFTDCVGTDPAGRCVSAKVLSNSALRARIARIHDAQRIELDAPWPARAAVGLRLGPLGGAASVRIVGREGCVLILDAPLDLHPGVAVEARSDEEAPVLAARLVTGTAHGEPLPAMSLRLATTRGTNALLERRGARTALFVSEGFADVLTIGDQQRPDLFALNITMPSPVYEAVVEVPGRIAADGTELRSLNVEPIAHRARELSERGVRSAAIALMHSWRSPAHERLLEDRLRKLGFTHVSRSSALAPLIKLVPRAHTAVADAYLAPVLGAYLERVSRRLRGGSVHVMTSAGGLVRADEFRAKDGLLSGPAGGVVGAAQAGRRSGFSRVIALDMGGTSTDASRFDGDYEYTFEHRVGDARILAPALAIETVAAGGGSICDFVRDELAVGPESAGADPGPACYGAGGPLTLTDVNLLLGRLDEDRFGIPIDADRARSALALVLRRVAERTGQEMEPEALLEGFLRIADERMADAIRRISVRKGYDPRHYALVVFGGAGGQHACGVAERLGVRTIVVPDRAGLLSAVGLGCAAIERFVQRQVLRPLGGYENELARLLDELGAEAKRLVDAELDEPGGSEVRRRIVNLRYAGQESSLAIEYAEPLQAAFEQRYRAVFGHVPGRAIEVESVRVVASSMPEEGDAWNAARETGGAPVRQRRVYFAGRWRRAPVHERTAIAQGTPVAGPALIVEPHSATIIQPGWEGRIDDAGALVLRQTAARRRRAAESELVRLELFTSRLSAIAAEMGQQLWRTAVSTNVKERLDYSCGLLDADGELLVNAPHIPVHLGALGLCVRAVRQRVPMEPGDTIVTNHPAYGGSHLPDVTLITPVHMGHRLVGYAANRAHHAEIGGTHPGSMPPRARRLDEEGVVIAPMRLVRAGAADWAAIRRLLAGSPHPTRALEENLADLNAQLAANLRGAGALAGLVEAEGLDAFGARSRALKARAARRVAAALAALGEGVYEAEERLDDGSPIRVRVAIRGSGGRTRAVVDFAGSAPAHAGNLNATPAIVRSAVLYVLRLMIDEPLPLNEGLMRHVDVRVPVGMLSPTFSDDPSRCPAVAAGNVETSQRIVDTLIKALGLAACSQGTMNNVVFGNERFGYYETVCGGSGATATAGGASAVHTHMTNTRLTDAEVLEHRYPVRVDRMAVRAGSGGAGMHRGGDGVIRELTFLEPASLSVITQHRAEAPFGVAGGLAGAPGRQRVVRADGTTMGLRSVDGCEVGPGDRLVLETPGGGGWGTEGGGA